MRKLALKNMALLMSFTFASLSWTGTAAMAADRFVDISASSPYLPYILDLQKLGVTDGIAENLFAPEQTLTRAQFAKFAAMAFRLKDSGTPTPFADIKGHWAEPYIRAAYQAGVVDGTSPASFSPDAPVKREEAALMVWRIAKQRGLASGAAGLSLSYEERPDAWAVEAVGAIIAHGWIGAEAARTTAGAWSYEPRRAMTRQEMAALLDRAMKDVPGSLAAGGNAAAAGGAAGIELPALPTPPALPAAPEVPVPSGAGDGAGSGVASDAAPDADLAPWQSALREHLTNRDTHFEIPLDQPEQFQQIKSFVKDSVLADDDYLHYVYDGMDYVYDGISTVTFNVRYLETKEQTEYVTAHTRTIVSSIITPGMNDVEKEKAVHDYIVSHIAYDQSLRDHTAYGALTKGVTVCQGYSLLTFRMLQEAGIPNKIIEGNAGGDLHTWNLVQLDGHWYHLDPTWDDPVPDEKGRVLYNYFNLTDDQMRHDHSWTGQYPSADTDFAQTLIGTSAAGGSDAQTGQGLLATLGLNVEAPDSTADTVAQAAAILQRELAAGASRIVFRYNNKLGDAENLINLTLTNNMMLKYGVHDVKYSMHQDTRATGYTIVTIQVSYLKQ